MWRFACLIFSLWTASLCGQEKKIIPDSIKTKLEQALHRFGATAGDPVFIRAFKSEYELELWIKKDSVFRLFRTYPVCNRSGELGPKRKQGDLQVPEGFYHVTRFNPNSSYHLSMGINYPNESDLHFSDPKRPGGAICIHGSCGSQGCIPIRDANIEEVYWLAWLASQKGQEHIPVHIFPCRMTPGKTENLVSGNFRHRHFWENLQPVYEYFEKTKKLPDIEVEKTGRYRIKE